MFRERNRFVEGYDHHSPSFLQGFHIAAARSPVGALYAGGAYRSSISMGMMKFLPSAASGSLPTNTTSHFGVAVSETGSNVPVVAAAVQQQIEQLKAQECVLLGEFGEFGWWVQGALGLLSFSTLLLKHSLEDQATRRPFKVFLFDAVKQACGSGLLHMMNLACASLFASCTHQEADPCEWYWLNIMLDTTLGVYTIKVLLNSGRRTFKLDGLTAFGFYGDPPRWSACWHQAFIWLLLVAIMKLIMILPMIVAQLPLSSLAGAVLNSLDNSPRLKLVVVMVLTPFTMNTLQYWVTDNILKNSGRLAGVGDYACAEWVATPRSRLPPSAYAPVHTLPGEQELVSVPSQQGMDDTGERSVATKL